MENEFNNITVDVVGTNIPEKSVKKTKISSACRRRSSKKTTEIKGDESASSDTNVIEKPSVDSNQEKGERELMYVYRDGVDSEPEIWNTSDSVPPKLAQSNTEKVGEEQESIPLEYQDNINTQKQESLRRQDKKDKKNNVSKNNNIRGRSNEPKQRFVKQVRIGQFNTGFMKNLECFESIEKLEDLANSSIDFSQEVFDFNEYSTKTAAQLLAEFKILDNADEDIENIKRAPGTKVLEVITNAIFADKRPIIVHGVLESIEGGDGLIVYSSDNYRIKPQSAFVSKLFIQKYGLRRGQEITAYLHPPVNNSTCPFVLAIKDVMGMSPEKVGILPKFKDLIPYYPTERLFLETNNDVAWDNRSMRIIDLLTPIGLGQRGLIVAPPRTGKTVLLQSIANAISQNRPDVALMILLIDERPEEVTDFRRQVPNAEITSSTFDESTDNHIHAADMVIDKARRKVEAGQHVVILLDSITRLARAHNAEQPSSGKLLSGGVDANALQLPKKFFGSARNIEGGGSLTILATALVDTGSRMDEVIFEEFKGTGNMELHLDRALVDKRIFPAINIEKSGTRKEELLYHPDELEKIYTLRRALKGVPGVDAMEMLIQRVKQTKTNIEFLLNVNR